MRWNLKVSDTAAPVSVELISQENGVYTFRVNSEIVTLSDAKAFAFSIAANQKVWALETCTSDLWRVSEGAKVFSIQPIRANQKAAANKNEVRTQMPGRILKVLVRPGEKVAPKQTLMIIEAMKMENEIRSDSDSIVESVEVAQGQSVESGMLLMKLKAS